ncbi:MAG: DNA-formamidopyrimidine glycosylase [Candidatus Nealsonbacteria bacterium CG23_combo_of_CG06-09_8_20_14_all_36_12]|uniref:Formamidopyrimidine-DNA glycosylase n=1 Tax=Candidatus Nealsonbacteria bacterium CG23_combo_of_CG06-09_8_20_14_all_36_12 TaxID=1974718 RepID=A0A2G9Z0N9_9BACT|nr:MAG: DNA-formamidopyrimidine glycosylase [Candidatus Nealsonbacteria bacterium CG23_combo_of_CG06-09_8_20_14_all_36_12]
MPELPEVETIVRDLKKYILGRKIEDVWSDFKKMVKKPGDFEVFKKEIIGRKIEGIKKRGKNILFKLSGGKTLLIHQKLTGHLLLGKWGKRGSEWQSLEKGPLLEDPMNRFLHLIFWLDDGRQLALSDLRKFAKTELWNSNELKESEELKSLGPEPLERTFTLEKFKETLQKAKGKIKQVLMDQTVIAGIGNIYSDEILWEAKVHPFKDVSKLEEGELKKIYQVMRIILPKAIELGGESISDFRRISGERGYFDRERKVYRRKGEPCSRCATKIKRVKLTGRSAHYCPTCQKL